MQREAAAHGVAARDLERRPQPGVRGIPDRSHHVEAVVPAREEDRDQDPLVVRDWRRGLAGGLAAFVGYAVVIWAMTQAPIAAVAALRETSVVFAALIGVVLLGEPFQGQRAVAAVVILAGVVALRLG